jgi:hypothetical protein
MRRTMAAVGLVSLIASCSASADEVRDKYHITNAEKVACTADAMRLCSGVYPDEDGLVACMKQNRAALTTLCRIAFDAGIKRRHL